MRIVAASLVMLACSKPQPEQAPAPPAPAPTPAASTPAPVASPELVAFLKWARDPAEREAAIKKPDCDANLGDCAENKISPFDSLWFLNFLPKDHSAFKARIPIHDATIGCDMIGAATERTWVKHNTKYLLCTGTPHVMFERFSPSDLYVTVFSDGYYAAMPSFASNLVTR